MTNHASPLDSSSCVFCRIVAGREPCSRVYEDESCLGFMGIRPIHPGELMIIPKEHIDHFCDVPDELAAHIMTIAQQLSRTIWRLLKPLRVGLVVHGFDVPHAHLIVVPQHGPTDITSGRFAYLNDGKIAYGIEHIREVPRAELDRMAAALSQQPPSWVRRDRQP